MTSAIPALAVIVAFLLAGGGVLQIRRGERLKGVLMLVMTAVLLGNTAILTL